jgi:hypothetical protein
MNVLEINLKTWTYIFVTYNIGVVRSFAKNDHARIFVVYFLLLYNIEVLGPVDKTQID